MDIRDCICNRIFPEDNAPCAYSARDLYAASMATHDPDAQEISRALDGDDNAAIAMAVSRWNWSNALCVARGFGRSSLSPEQISELKHEDCLISEADWLEEADEPTIAAEDEEDEEPPALEDVLACVAASAPKSTIVLLDGAKACAIPATKIGELLAPAPEPEQQTMPGILDHTKLSKEWRDSMAPKFARINGKAVYVTQGLLF